MKKILIIAVFLTSSISAKDPTLSVSCGFVGSPDSLTGIGDSRAWQIDLRKNIENEANSTGDAVSIALSPANSNGQRIISPNQVNMISRSAPGSTSAQWVNKIKSCGTIFVPNKVFINVGGNDLIDALKEKDTLLDEYKAFMAAEAAEAQAQLLEAIVFFTTGKFSAARRITIRNVLHNGLQLFNNLLDKFKAELFKPKSSRIRFPAAHSFNFHNFWNWRSEQRIDEVVANVKFISKHFLDQGANVLLNAEAPVTLLDPSRESIGTIPDGNVLDTSAAIAKDFPEALKLMYNLRIKYALNVYPYLLTLETGRIIFVDSYDVFFNNIARSGANFYVQDGVHLSRLGLLEWGREMATAMVQAGWYTAGPGYTTPGQPKFYSDLDVHKYHMYTTFKAIENNVPWNVVFDREMQFQETGYSKDFPENGTTLYIMKDDTEVYTLSGTIRAKYKAMGEGSSGLGFPTSDVYTVWYDTIERVDFECGRIDHNRLDLVNPTYVSITKPDCSK